MKKWYALLPLLYLAFARPATAQNLTSNRFRFGARAALNLSRFTNSKLFEDDEYYFKNYVRPCIAIGLTADYAVTPQFNWGAELVYNQRGGSFREQNSDVTIIYNNGNTSTGYNYLHFVVDYLELPLLAKYDVTKPAARTGFVIYGGVSPSVTVNTGIKYTYYEGEGVARTRTLTQNLDNVRSFNTSGTFGFQIVGKQSARSWYADIRGSYAFLPVFSGYEANANTHMFTGSIGFGLKF